MGKLTKMLLTGIVLAEFVSLVGCSGGRFYFGSWPLGSDLSYEQKKEIMERRNEEIEAEIRERPFHRDFYEIEPVPLISYEF